MNQNSKNSKSSRPVPLGKPAPLGKPVPLRELLSQAARTAILDAPVQLEVDVPAGAQFSVDAGRLTELVTAMVRGSLACLPAGGEITLTLWQTAGSCEIEVADNGPPIESRPRRLPMVAASLGAELLWQNCPQGGAAVTATLRRPQALREAA
ncbi:histidine kinase [Candidatus Laterigemmans baculatus]|uniref:HAMP domain-containing histidine kinase n=1 Tax=Candidatus Laterigemmans baculatus TaxID=2770505 RepID=UPI0013DBB2EA|nr:HAMP domain-containing histidine kinase [Candidatus Laterigemmans baculatus]